MTFLEIFVKKISGIMIHFFYNIGKMVKNVNFWALKASLPLRRSFI